MQRYAVSARDFVTKEYTAKKKLRDFVYQQPLPGNAAVGTQGGKTVDYNCFCTPYVDSEQVTTGTTL